MARHGGRLVPDSLTPPYIPGPGELFTSWLPSPAAPLHLSRTGDVTVATFTHLTWTTLAGLAVVIPWRARHWWKLLAVVPFAAAVAHHTLNNYAAGPSRGEAAQWLESLDGALWAAPVLALLIASAADMAWLRRGKRGLIGYCRRGSGRTATPRPP